MESGVVDTFLAIASITLVTVTTLIVAVGTVIGAACAARSSCAT